MVGSTTTGVQDRLTLEELGELLLLPDEEFNRLAGEPLINIAEFFAFSLTEPGKPTDESLLKRINAFKEKALRMPGQLLYFHILALTGGRLCELFDKYDYCKKRARFIDAWSEFKQVKADLPIVSGTFTAAGGLAVLHQYYTEYADIVEGIVGIIALPKVTMAKVLFYILEEQCPCCEKCKGSGKNDRGFECANCDGEGHTRHPPFGFRNIFKSRLPE